MRARFFRLTALNIAANVTVPLVGLVDAAMLGHLPDLRFLAGTAIAAALFDYLYWSLNFLRMSTTGLVAQARGSGDVGRETRILYRSLVLALLLGVLVVALQHPIRRLGFTLLQLDPDLTEAATAYFTARIWSAPATLAGFAFLGWLLGRAESGQVLALTLIANLTNIALNYLLILRLDLAAFGAGLATTLSQYLMLGAAALLLLRGRRRPRWTWSEIARPSELLKLLSLNRDIFLRTLCLTAALAVFTALSARFGPVLLAANALLLRLFNVAAYIVDGAAYAVESLAGTLYGAGRVGDLQHLLRLALTTAVALAGLFLLVVAPAGPVPALLTSHEDVLEQLARFGPWLIPVVVFGSVAFVYDGFFLGLTRGRELRNAMLIATAGIFLPLAGFALWRADNHLLWLAMAAWMLSRAVLLWRALRKRPLSRLGTLTELNEA